MPTATHTITLSAGECFNLPANSELIYSSDPGSLSSECDIPTEFTLTCYRFAFENQNNPPVSDAVFIGLVLDNTFYQFSAEFDYSSNDVFTELENNMPAGFYIPIDDCSESENPRRVFKSVGKEIYLKVKNPTGTDTVGGSDTFFYIKAEAVSPCTCDGELI